MYQMQCSLNLLSLYILCFKKVDAIFVKCVSTNYQIIWHNWNLISCIKINQPPHFVLTHIPFYISGKKIPSICSQNSTTMESKLTALPTIHTLDSLTSYSWITWLRTWLSCMLQIHMRFFFYKYRYIPIGKWFTSKISSHFVLVFLFHQMTNGIAFNLIPYLSIQMLLVAEIHPAGRHALTCFIWSTTDQLLAGYLDLLPPFSHSLAEISCRWYGLDNFTYITPRSPVT